MVVVAHTHRLQLTETVVVVLVLVVTMLDKVQPQQTKVSVVARVLVVRRQEAVAVVAVLVQ